MTVEKTTHGVPPEEVMAYLDGELGADDAAAVAAHLGTCRECAALAEELGGVSRELRQWTVEPAPAGIEREVRKAVREGVAGPRRGVGLRVWKWGAAVTFAALLIAVVVGRQSYRKSALMKPLMPQLEDSASSRTDAYVSQNMAALSQIASGAAAPAPPAPQKADRFRGDVEKIGTGPLSPMIARTASLTVLVKNVAEARSALEAAMAREKGYAAQLTFSTPEGGARSLQASLRVPAGQLPAALEALRKLGRVQEELQSGEEVTAQHADLAARLTNSREEETRLRALLQQRTGKIDDVLQVEEEIARVRGAVEQMEAEQKGLEHRVDFATVDLRLVEEYTAQLGSPAESTGTQLRNGLVAGVRNAGASLLGLVVFVEECGPVMAIWGILLGVPGWLLWRRYRRARASLR